MSTARIPDGTPRPKLLDLFCGAGGAAMGYHRAGFDVTGVDIKPQPRYPFTFIQADAMTFPLDGFDAIHASPPCQDYSRAMRCFVQPGQYPRLIDPVRERLTAAAVPWVIENVPGAPLPHQSDLFGAHGVELCGSMFGLPIWRHRLFEVSSPLIAPRSCDHTCQPMNPHKAKRPGGRTPESRWREAMGVGWMDKDCGREAIPPAYTEYIGAQLMEVLGWLKV